MVIVDPNKWMGTRKFFPVFCTGRAHPTLKFFPAPLLIKYKMTWIYRYFAKAYGSTRISNQPQWRRFKPTDREHRSPDAGYGERNIHTFMRSWNRFTEKCVAFKHTKGLNKFTKSRENVTHPNPGSNSLFVYINVFTFPVEYLRQPQRIQKLCVIRN